MTLFSWFKKASPYTVNKRGVMDALESLKDEDNLAAIGPDKISDWPSLGCLSNMILSLLPTTVSISTTYY